MKKIIVFYSETYKENEYVENTHIMREKGTSL